MFQEDTRLGLVQQHWNVSVLQKGLNLLSRSNIPRANVSRSDNRISWSNSSTSQVVFFIIASLYSLIHLNHNDVSCCISILLNKQFLTLNSLQRGDSTYSHGTTVRISSVSCKSKNAIRTSISSEETLIISSMRSDNTIERFRCS